MSATPAPQAQLHFTRALDARLASFLEQQAEVVRQISPDAVPLVERIATLTAGGKRLRPLFAFWGSLAAGGRSDDPALPTLGAALELFQAAALIHDDLIDHSDTRRGGPSVHRRFEALHRESAWDLDAQDFGTSAAILAGDLALSMSEQLFAQALPTPRARDLFDVMRTQVMAGQYLDVLEEQIGGSRTPAEAVAAARTVVRFKSAKYSVENPVLLGAAQAGADEALLARLSEFALPLGEAFQLRDDELGVFGDPATTGKPAGDDLREGKRTLLIALTRERAQDQDSWDLLSHLGRPDLSEPVVEAIRTMMRQVGALAAHEEIIESLTQQALSALDAAGLPEQAREGLRTAGLRAVRRSA
ncbi:polyprenyl synthetase family protein [Galactobacter caseinivorans]|uniref:Polyprenyl synthetase family protein n=1 Tax=Galactobacter caseinivorans TaxID=2676123 RepID=A0A496PMH3_9MICC|nr:polyprenyl synthetase family protein [Galactobacter caseinivorans]RKW71656.1 polyprenyl synthetase family protein [Galactobacter caseinivorans]